MSEHRNIGPDTRTVAILPRQPTEAMWSGLARDLVMWWGMGPRPTGKALYLHLCRLSRDVPDWLREEIPDVDHVPPKGTVAACIWKAMYAAALQESAAAAREPPVPAESQEESITRVVLACVNHLLPAVLEANGYVESYAEDEIDDSCSPRRYPFPSMDRLRAASIKEAGDVLAELYRCLRAGDCCPFEGAIKQLMWAANTISLGPGDGNVVLVHVRCFLDWMNNHVVLAGQDRG